MSDSVFEKARRAVEALGDLRREALSECGAGADSSGAAPGSFALAWDEGTTAQGLADQALRAAARSVSDLAAFRTGCIYCYACASAACEHAAPPAPGHVATGYESTGRPRWEELFNFLLQLGDERTDLLFARPPEVLARVVGRRRLTADQLASFGKNSLTYRVWGQVVAGYLRLGDLRAGLTIQLVETADSRLRLQVIADAKIRDALANAPEDRRSAFHRVHDAIGEARRQVFSLSNLWQMTSNGDVRREVRGKAFGVLRHLAHSIERKGRQHKRRTAHAELRGQQRRPIHKAYEDLLASASRTDFFRDTVKQSIIVLGRGGRLHAFNDTGKHVTSLTIRGDELERRRRRRRYLPLATADAEAFRNTAIAAMSDGAAAP